MLAGKVALTVPFVTVIGILVKGSHVAPGMRFVVDSRIKLESASHCKVALLSSFVMTSEGGFKIDCDD